MQRADWHRARLDVREQTCLIGGGRDGLRLFLRGLRSTASSRRGVVLYLHGATFPSALSVAYRFDGVSWRDALCSAGFDVWALDFLGFGGSDRYPEMDANADANAPLGVAADVVTQVKAAVQFILDQGNDQRVSLVTHSWGSMPAGLFAAKHPTLVDRIVMFAPLSRREGPRYTPRPTLPAWKLVTNDQQWARFIEDVPPANRTCSCAMISRPGPKPISTAILPHAAEARRQYRHRPVRSLRSCAPGTANSRGSPETFKRRSQSSAGIGMGWSPIRTLAGCSSGWPDQPSAATSRSGAEPT
jgi:pimeloyl-ACP methyl ester carboxylesterase